MGEYPKIWLNGAACDDAGLVGEAQLWALHPDHPPRVTAVPTVMGVTTPGRDGALWTPQGAHLAPLFTVVLVLAGVGGPKDDGYAMVEYATDMWSQVVSTPRVEIKHQIAASGAGSIRYNVGRIVSFDVERTALDYAKLTMVFELPQPFWGDSPAGSPTISFVQSNVVSSATLSIDASGSTAPMIDGQIRITGPTTNPTFHDLTSGDWIKYTGAVAAGQTLRFDLNTLRAYLGTTASVTWTSTAGEVSSAVTIGGTGNYMPTQVRFIPKFTIFAGSTPLSGAIETKLVGTGHTSATKVEVQGRRAYR